jgi:hypothetical protein
LEVDEQWVKQLLLEYQKAVATVETQKKKVDKLGNMARKMQRK